MSPPLLLLASTVAVAAATTLHLALLMRAVRSARSPAWARALCVPVPPLVAYVGWRAGARGLVYVWAVAWSTVLLLAPQVLR